MALIVQKYGGTSMGDIGRIKNVAARIKRWHDNDHRLVIVASAMSGETNRLIDLAKQICPNIDAREYDQLVSTGEQVAIALLTMALKALGLDAISLTGRQVAINTDATHSKARILHIDTDAIMNALDAQKIVVVAGFQGISPQGDITTLGRGGSDTTGVALAAALQADECQIYTDVDGVYTTDPRIAPKAQKLAALNFDEMLEMASLGSKVLQIRSVEFAAKYQVPLRVLSSFERFDDGHFDDTFKHSAGTLISANAATHTQGSPMERPLISGIACNRDEAKIIIKNAPDRPGVASAILTPIGQANIEIDMIVQNSLGGGKTDLAFTLKRSDLTQALALLESIKAQIGIESLIAHNDVAKVSIIGMGMRSHAGIASQMLQTLAKQNINIQLISTGEIKISVLIDENALDKAVVALHSDFGLDRQDGKHNQIAGI